MKKITNFGEKVFSFFGLVILLLLVIILFKPLAYKYLNMSRPVGGDYYNGLTYAVHFAKHIPFPPMGWLSFWHQGIPIIGGYPTTSFYLMSPLFAYFEPAAAMEIYGVVTLLLFLLIAAVTFRTISGSIPFALLLTILLFLTRATYYQLFAEGFVIASAMQWTLPLAILWVYKFLRTQKNKYLLLIGTTLGLAVLLHPAMGMLTVVIPIFFWLLVHFGQKRAFKKLLSAFLIIGILIIGIGGPTILMLIKFNIESTGSGKCTSPQCWGVYPEHFARWFTPWTLILPIILLLLLGIVKLFRKHINILANLEALSAVLILGMYLLFAYLHLIDSFAGGVFPRRIFWAINLLLLITAATSFRTLAQSFGKRAGYVFSAFTVLGLIGIYGLLPHILTFDTASIFAYPGSTPANINEYIIPKYKEHELTELLPTWVITKSNDGQYRFDSLNHQVYQWWNTFAKSPSTRGYSNSPSGMSANWLYYFQVGTAENPVSLSPQLIRNRTLFLLDHYAVGLYDDSAKAASGGKLGYALDLLKDSNRVVQHESVRELSFYELSPQIISPIVSATNATPLLIISDENGYETIVRALSYTGLTSNTLIPVKGPDTIDGVTAEQLKIFPAIFLYRFKGTHWNLLTEYIQKGGTLVADLGSLKKIPPLPEFFPTTSFSEIFVKEKLVFKPNDSTLLQNVNIDEFAPFVYNNGEWNLWVSSSSLKPETTSILAIDQGGLFLSSKLGMGMVFVSGLNFPFHINDTQNYEEVKFFKNLLTSFIGSSKETSKINLLKRDFPEHVEVNGTFRGIYFKENYDPGWTASTKNGRLPLYVAGPQFMYIPTSNIQSTITLQYRGTSITWSLFILSLITIALALIFFILPDQIKKYFVTMATPIITLLSQPFTKLQTEEHENY